MLNGWQRCSMRIFILLAAGTSLALGGIHVLADESQTAGSAADAGSQASPAQAAYARGIELLEQADFEGALAQFALAAEQAPREQSYRQQHAMVRQVMAMRDAVTQQEDAEHRAAMEQALRAFYYQYGLYDEALALDRAALERVAAEAEDAGRLAAAERLAETQLERGENESAAAALGAFPAEALTANGRLLYALALARAGRAQEANAVVDHAALTQSEEPAERYFAARLYAQLGNQERVVAHLTHLFETTLPSRLEELKTRVRACPDFRSLAGEPSFAQVLATKSKVEESSCSSGASCGGCPRASRCGQ